MYLFTFFRHKSSLSNSNDKGYVQDKCFLCGSATGVASAGMASRSILRLISHLLTVIKDEFSTLTANTNETTD